MNAINVVMTRLNEDRKGVEALARRHPAAVHIVETRGNPPTGYTVRLNCRTVVSLSPNGPTLAPFSVVKIDLPDGYPLKRPTAQLLTPVFNPHIFANNVICFGSAWQASESLDQFIGRIWRILVWDPLVIDPGSPANGAAIAWAKNNPDQLPFDRTAPGDPPNPAPEAPAAKPSITWR